MLGRRLEVLGLRTLQIIQFVRDRILPSRLAQLFLQTGLKWQQDHCPAWGAALSHYALFSLFPIWLVALSVLGRILGPGTEAFSQLQALGSQVLPSEARDLVEGTLVSLNRTSTGAGLIGFGLLMYAASTVFGVLSQAVNVIWKVNVTPARPRPLRQTVMTYVINKAIAFVLVLGTALLLLFSLLGHIWVEAVIRLVDRFEEQFTWLQVNDGQLATGLQQGAAIMALAIVTLILLKILPATRIAWRDIWPGALLTSASLALLQRLVSSSVISIGSRYASYGVVGSVMILLLWIYFVCQLFFMGCELSYVYAHLFGSRRESRHLKR